MLQHLHAKHTLHEAKHRKIRFMSERNWVKIMFLGCLFLISTFNRFYHKTVSSEKMSHSFDLRCFFSDHPKGLFHWWIIIVKMLFSYTLAFLHTARRYRLANYTARCAWKKLSIHKESLTEQLFLRANYFLTEWGNVGEIDLRTPVRLAQFCREHRPRLLGKGARKRGG